MLLLAACLCGPNGSNSLRENVIRSALFTGVWVVAGCELLSLFHALSFPFLLAWWLAPCIALSWPAWRRKRGVAAAFGTIKVPDWTTRLMLILAILITVATLYVALFTPPTTVDCLCYHLPRQVYWMLQSGVQHYPAQDLRQLEMPPFAEFAGVHLMILAHSDWPANLVQWASLILAAIASSLIARELGAKPSAQALASVLVLSIPGAMTQSVNPKNDVVVAALALATLHPAVQIWLSRRCTRSNLIGMSIAAGLLLLTKGTAFFVLLPIGAFAAVGIFRAIGPRGIRVASAMAAAVIAINAGHAVRNYRLFGNPTHLPESRGGYALTNSTFAPSAIASNIVRNLALAVSLPNAAYRTTVYDCVQRVHEVLDISPDDTRTTWSSQYKFGVYDVWYSDGNNPAPIHVLSYTTVLALIAIAMARRRAPAAWPVYLIPLVAFVALCVVIRWQPWNNRLLIPIVALAVPPVARGLGNKTRWYELPLALFSVLAAATAFIGNTDKPLTGPKSVLAIPRDRALFTVQPYYFPLVQALAEQLQRRAPVSVGVFSEDQTVYLLLRQLVFTRLKSIHLVPVSSMFGPPIPESVQPPDLIIVWHRDAQVRKELVFKGVRYAPNAVIELTGPDGQPMQSPPPFVLMSRTTKASEPAH